MECRAEVLHALGEEWRIEEISIDMVPPAEMLAGAGIALFFPIIGGHEGAGVVAEVGPGVTSVQVGDRVSASFIPSCGRCRFCSTGRQNLCDAGAGAMQAGMITDGTSSTRALSATRPCVPARTSEA